MGEIIARFADNRLLVQEEKLAEEGYLASSTIGLRFRIGHLKTVEHVLTLDAHVSGHPGTTGDIVTPLKECLISGDTLHIVMRRCDLGVSWISSSFGALFISGFSPETSGLAAVGYLSGITSGILLGGTIRPHLSGGLGSGIINIRANVIGI